MADDVQATVKNYILEEFLPGEDPNELQIDTPLISGGILDSIGRLKLVSYLEQQFGISIAAHEASTQLDTIADIVQLVDEKRRTKK